MVVNCIMWKVAIWWHLIVAVPMSMSYWPTCFSNRVYNGCTVIILISSDDE